MSCIWTYIYCASYQLVTGFNAGKILSAVIGGDADCVVKVTTATPVTGGDADCGIKESPIIAGGYADCEFKVIPAIIGEHIVLTVN